MKNDKGANINVGNIPCQLLYPKMVFSKWKDKINLSYYFHILLICMNQFKCHVKENPLKCNVGYLSSNGES